MSIADTVAIKKCIADVALLRRELSELHAQVKALGEILASSEPRRETLHVGNKNKTQPWAPPTTR